MRGRFFAHGTVRTDIGIFGSLFNRIFVARFSNDGKSIDKLIHVPILYSPRSRIFKESSTPEVGGMENVYKKFYETYPRMGFALTGLSYNAAKQLPPSLNARAGKQHGKVPAPYELSFVLTIVAKSQFEALQIVEQIIPHFKPNITLSVKSEVFDKRTRDFTVHLNSVAFEDDYDNLDKERYVVYNLEFTVRTSFWSYVHGADIELAKFVECGGKVDIPIDENWPGDGDNESDGVLIEKVIMDTHHFGVWPQIWPTIERETITARTDGDQILGYEVHTESEPEHQIPVDYSTSEE